MHGHVLSPFQINRRSGFSVGQTFIYLTKFMEKCDDIYDIQYTCTTKIYVMISLMELIWYCS